MPLQNAIGFLKQTFDEWTEDQAPRLAAALAYYAVFAIGPIVFLTVTVVSLVLSDAGSQITEQLQSIVGAQAAEFIATTVASQKTGSGVIATIIGTATLLIAASALFGELQSSLNAIWDVQQKPGQGFVSIIRNRLFSFAMVAVAGLLLLLSMLASTFIAVVITFFREFLPGGDFVWQFVNFGVATAIGTLIFALLFKFVPDVRIRWRDVWVGALVTAVLFTIGQVLLGWYLGRQSTTSVYGAAGSLIALLLWVYYATQILFFGAEFTQVYARRRGQAIEPSRNAIRVDVKMMPGGGVSGAAKRDRAAPADAARAPAAGDLTPFLLFIALSIGTVVILRRLPRRWR